MNAAEGVITAGFQMAINGIRVPAFRLRDADYRVTVELPISPSAHVSPRIYITLTNVVACPRDDDADGSGRGSDAALERSASVSRSVCSATSAV